MLNDLKLLFQKRGFYISRHGSGLKASYEFEHLTLHHSLSQPEPNCHIINIAEW